MMLRSAPNLNIKTGIIGYCKHVILINLRLFVGKIFEKLFLVWLHLVNMD